MAINFKDEVARVREVLKKIGFTTEIPAATETQAADALAAYATESGAIVKIDKLEPGGMIYDADGVSPITTDVTLQDGTIVANDGAGMITAVTLPASNEPPKEVPVIPGTGDLYEQRIAALETKLAAYEEAQTANVQKFADQETAAKAREKSLSEALEHVVSLVEKFAAQPSDEPAQKPQGAVTKDGTTKADRREAFAKNISARKTAAV